MDRLFPPVQQRAREFIHHILSLEHDKIDLAEKARWRALIDNVRLKIPLQQSTSNIAESIVTVVDTKET
jgi:hypothetical protein